MVFAFFMILNIFLNSCKEDLKKQNLIEENIFNPTEEKKETKNELKHIIFVNETNTIQNTTLILGSGANHFFSFDEQPRSFGTCIDPEPNTLTPSSIIKADLFLKVIKQEKKVYEKDVNKISKKLTSEASIHYFSGNIKSFLNHLTNLVNESKNEESGVQINFEARRTFSPIAVKHISINSSVMDNVNRNPWNFYTACGTGAVASIAKEAHFTAKALCNTSDSTSIHESLNEMDRSSDIKIASKGKGLYEFSGGFEMASSLSSIINSLSKYGIKECRWELKTFGLPYFVADANLVDTEDLVKIANRGLNLIMQASYESASITDMEILPYYDMPPLREHASFFDKFNSEVKDTEKWINKFHDGIQKQLNFLTPVARSIGLDLNNSYISDSIKSLEMSIERFNHNRLNPVANRQYSEE